MIQIVISAIILVALRKKSFPLFLMILGAFNLVSILAPWVLQILGMSLQGIMMIMAGGAG